MSRPKAQARSALKLDLVAGAARKHKIETLGDPLQVIARHIDFDHLTQVIDQLLPRGDASRGGRPTYPTAVMVRILILKYLYNLSAFACSPTAPTFPIAIPCGTTSSAWASMA